MTSFQLLLIRCCRAACRCRSPQSCWAVKLCTTTPNVRAVPAPQAFLIKLYTTDGGAKLLRRKWVPSAAELLLPPAACNCVVAGNVLGPNLSPHANWPASPSADVQCCHAAARTRRSGEVERQIRYNVGKLPVAYRTEPDGRWVLVLLLLPPLCCCSSRAASWFVRRVAAAGSAGLRAWHAVQLTVQHLV